MIVIKDSTGSTSTILGTNGENAIIHALKFYASWGGREDIAQECKNLLEQIPKPSIPFSTI